MEVDWNEEFKSPSEVERKLATLLLRLYPGATHVDGSGGDGGRDVQLERGGVLTLWEIKSFPDRINTKARKRQIRESLITAAELQPDEWWLVAPLTLNPTELTWFDGLRNEFSFISGHRSRTWIGAQLALHPDLLESFKSVHEKLLTAAKEYSLEAAAMTNGLSDFAERQSNLLRRADSISEHYAVRPGFLPNGEHVTEIIAKSTDAPALLESITLGLPGDTENADLMRIASEVRATIDVGLHSEILIPRDLIRSTVVSPTGKELGLSDQARVEQILMTIATEEVSVPVTLTVYRDDTPLPLRHQFTLLNRRTGRRGVTLSGIDAQRTVELTMSGTPRSPEQQLVLGFLEVERLLPAAAIPAMRLSLAMMGNFELEVQVDGTVVGDREAGCNEVPDSEREERARVLEAIQELAFVQDRTGQYFDMPEYVTPGHRAALAKIATLLRTGEHKQWISGPVSATLPPGYDATTVLSQFPQEPSAIAMSDNALSFSLFDQQVDVGPAVIYSSGCTIENRTEVESGNASGLLLKPLTGWWHVRLGTVLPEEPWQTIDIMPRSAENAPSGTAGT